ncbi:hypothetical protein KUTG_01438 [Kutzneria sp. 744]|nr:hypothetical protein KUTG_01438 [Kutzneria sp. 744]
MAEATPLDRKLGIKPGHLVTLRHAPPGWMFPDVTVLEGDPRRGWFIPWWIHTLRGWISARMLLISTAG